MGKSKYEFQRKGRGTESEDGDDDGIDYWREPEFDEKEVAGALLEESDFLIMFPQYRSAYLQQVWSAIKKILGEISLKCEIDLVKRQMSVSTTRKTYDPFAILKARDMLRLVARGVPVSQAKRVLESEVTSEIIKIGGLVRNKERFARRRQRLIGPNGSTLKVIEILTKSYVCVSGQTVCAIGSHKSINKVRKVVIDCMNNLHPIYNLKSLMVRRELEKNQELKEQDWNNYVPHFKKHRQNR